MNAACIIKAQLSQIPKLTSCWSNYITVPCLLAVEFKEVYHPIGYIASYTKAEFCY